MKYLLSFLLLSSCFAYGAKDFEDNNDYETKNVQSNILEISQKEMWALKGYEGNDYEIKRVQSTIPKYKKKINDLNTGFSYQTSDHIVFNRPLVSMPYEGRPGGLYFNNESCLIQQVKHAAGRSSHEIKREEYTITSADLYDNKEDIENQTGAFGILENLGMSTDFEKYWFVGFTVLLSGNNLLSEKNLLSSDKLTADIICQFPIAQFPRTKYITVLHLERALSGSGVTVNYFTPQYYPDAAVGRTAKVTLDLDFNFDLSITKHQNEND